jgi:diacylglycerol kinase (ATP)
MPIGRREIVEDPDGLLESAAEVMGKLRGLEAGRAPESRSTAGAHPWQYTRRSPKMNGPLACQLVFNPQSGNGQACVLAERLEEHLHAVGRAAVTLAVHDFEEARRRLVERRGEFGHLVCIGGDHTLSELAPVAVALGVPLVPVPAGFGNMFARTFGHHASPSTVLDLLEHGRIRRVDVGVSDGGLFLCSQGFGLLEEIKQAVETRPEIPRFGPLRYLAYVKNGLRATVTSPLSPLTVELDGRVASEEAAVVIVANVPTYQSFLPLTPEATPLDGLLDVFIVPRMSRPALFSLMVAFLVRLPGRWRMAISRRAARVSVVPCDGKPQELTILPAALPLLVPPDPVS